MSKQWLFAGFLLLVVTNGIILLTISYNRSSQIENLTFSERELRKHTRSSQIEDSTISLQLNWRTALLDQNHYAQLKVTKDVLNSFGFYETECANEPLRSFRKEREAWVLMELSGEAYLQDIANLKEKLKEAESTVDNLKENISTKDIENALYRMENTDTRLYAIDVNLERDALIHRVSLGDGRFVVRGVISDGYKCSDYITVKRLLTNYLYVGKNLLSVDEGLPEKYHAVLAIGRLGHAWLESITTRK